MQAEDAQGNTVDAPDGGFRVEFYKQGHLAEVSKNPLTNPELLQEFLDQHLILGDAIADEKAIVEELEHNSAELRPLEAGSQQRVTKRTTAARDQHHTEDRRAGQASRGGCRADSSSVREGVRDHLRARDSVTVALRSVDGYTRPS